MNKLYYAGKQSWLSWFARGIVFLAYLILFIKLFELQIIKGNYYRQLSDSNRIRRVVIFAPRGKILARGGEVLVGNKQVIKKIEFQPEKGYFLTDNTESADDDEKIVFWQRDYLLSEKFAHVSGYLGEVNQNEVGTIDPDCAEKGPRILGQMVGRGGLEEKFNCLLSGIDGEELVEIDTTGKKIRTLGIKNPIPGQDLKTNIDFGLQIKVAEEMKEKKGAFVVTDTKGEVLAIYSSPSFDPNVFILKDDENKVETLLNDSNLPLFNRVISGKYHPGSVFKPLIAIAALEEGIIDKDFTYKDEGFIEIKSPYGNYSYTNWYYTQYGKTEGEIGLIKALGRSTDTFFYKLGEMVGIDNIVAWAKRFRFDKKSNIDLPGEISGFVPDPEWKERTLNEKWFLGNTYHLAIGQGDLSLTPIQVNMEISTVASSGNLCQPRIVGNSPCENLKLNGNNLNIVEEGMIAACSNGGTAYPFFDFNPDNRDDNNRVACKTGTAETQILDKTHAWFSAFAPVELPEIVATVMVEGGGEGSRDAAPIARKVFDYYFTR